MNILSFEEYTANQILEKLYPHDIPTTKRPGNLDDIISRMCNAGYTFLGTISMTGTRPKINRPETLVNVVPEQIREKIKSNIPTGMIVLGVNDPNRIVEVMSQPYLEKVVKYNDDVYVLWNPDELYFYCVKPDIYSTVFAGYFIETRTKGVEQTLKDNGIETNDKPVNENAEWTYRVTLGDMVKCICEWGAVNVDNVDDRHFEKIVDSMYDIFKDWYEQEKNPIDNTPLNKTVVSISVELLGEYGDDDFDGDIDVSDLYDWYDDLIDCFKKIPEFEEIAKTMTEEDYEDAIYDYICDNYRNGYGEFTY